MAYDPMNPMMPPPRPMPMVPAAQPTPAPAPLGRAALPAPGPAPQFQISPEHLAILEKRGFVSPQAIAQRKMMDARMGMGGNVGFEAALSGGLPGVSAPLPAQASAPAAPKAKPQDKKPQSKPLTAKQQKQAAAWEGLVSSMTWVDPQSPEGFYANPSNWQGVHARKLPPAAFKLLNEMYPDKVAAGLVPAGWGDKTLTSLPDDQKAILAQLMTMHQAKQEESGKKQVEGK